MAVINSPNMGLPVPVVGSEPGPDYASDINSSLTLIDQHNHNAGSGVQITPGGININSDLTFQSNRAISVGSMVFSPNVGALATINTIYQQDLDLYFIDGAGNNVRITQSGGVAGSPGSISNLVAPASASYVAGQSAFVWQSDANIAANLDAGSLKMRNISPNSTYALNLQPPAALSSNYNVTLPSLPASTKLLTMSSSGVIVANTDVDNSTIEISSNNLQVKASGIGTTQIADGTVTNAKFATANFVQSAMSPGQTVTSTIFTNVTNFSVAITTSGRPVAVDFYATAGATWRAFSGGPNVSANFLLLRNAVAIQGTGMFCNDTTIMDIPINSLNFVDYSVSGAPGTYTYSLQMCASVAGQSAILTAGSAYMVVREL